MEEELRGLAGELKACHRDRAGRRRVDADLRCRIVATARRLREAGWRWRSMAEALEVSASQLHRWVATTPEAAFAAVEVVADEGCGESDRACSDGLTLVTPSGFELRGLSFEQAETLLVSLVSIRAAR